MSSALIFFAFYCEAWSKTAFAYGIDHSIGIAQYEAITKCNSRGESRCIVTECKSVKVALDEMDVRKKQGFKLGR